MMATGLTPPQAEAQNTSLDHHPRQTGILQSTLEAQSTGSLLPLTISEDLHIPEIKDPHHVLIRIRAVALNPTDHKMVKYFPLPDHMVGCDYSGVVEQASREAKSAGFTPGTRVSSGTFPYIPGHPDNGAFAEWIVADYRLLLKLPAGVDDLQGAALGGVGWGTAGLALYDPNALGLSAYPSTPTTDNEPILIYGGGTASATMAMQILKQSGYQPIAVSSPTSHQLCIDYGASGVAHYTVPDCVGAIKSLAGNTPIRRALDCIATAESAATCFAALARTGGRYACLETLPESCRTRRRVTVKEVMGFESLGVSINLGDNSYSRVANEEAFSITTKMVTEVQGLLDRGRVKSHPIREIPGKWQGIFDGLETLLKGEVRGHKLVVRISAA